MIRQAPLLDAIDVLTREWDVDSPFDSTGPIGPTGFAGFELDLSVPQIVVYWKYGVAIPAAASERLDQVRAAGIQLEVLKSPFSLEDLRDELRQLSLEVHKSRLPISRLGPARGAAGLSLGSPEPARVLSHSVYKGALKRLASKSKRPPEVSIVVEEEPIWQLLRTADRSPYWGGSNVVSAGGAICTSGFSVGNVWGKYLIFAGHCAADSNGIRIFTGDGRTVGWTSAAQPVDPGSLDALDVLLISNLYHCPGANSVCAVTGPTPYAYAFTGDRHGSPSMISPEAWTRSTLATRASLNWKACSARPSSRFAC